MRAPGRWITARAALPWLAALALILGAAWVRLAFDALDHLDAALAARQAGDLTEAAERAQYALRAYTPGAAAPQAAAALLLNLADTAEARGDRAGALAALRRLRGGVRATRWLLSPFGHLAEPVDRRLAALTADEQLAQGDPTTLRGRDRAALVADHAALLALDPVPRPAVSAWVVLSFFGWVGGAACTLRRGLDPAARLRRKPFARWAAFTALALASWLWALTAA